MKFKNLLYQEKFCQNKFFFAFKYYICSAYLIYMLIIPVKEGESIDKAIKRFKRKFDKTGKLKSVRERQAFVKPSVKYRNKIIKASYIQKLRDKEASL